MSPWFRHPMERLESLYSNKFTDIQKHDDRNSTDICPGRPFRRRVLKIISERKEEPGPEFRFSLTPNEFIKKVESVNLHHDKLWCESFYFYRFVLDNIKTAGYSGIINSTYLTFYWQFETQVKSMGTGPLFGDFVLYASIISQSMQGGVN